MNLPLSANKKVGVKTVRNSSKDAIKLKYKLHLPVKKEEDIKIL